MTEIENQIDPDSDAAVEFSRPVDVTTIGASGREIKLSATEEECAALATRFSVLSMDNLMAECHLIPTKRGEYKLTASFSVNVVQSCIISLDPIEDILSSNFEVSLLNSSRRKSNDNVEIEFDVDEEDFEYITSNQIDVGEIIAQHLSLEINPYPRKQEATGDELGIKILKEEEVVLESQKKNPFAVLKSLKHKT